MTPPMLCMLLRKHLQGAKLCGVEQAGFERVAMLEFETRDEMGFECRRYLIAEIMGKYSNLIFTDEDERILAVLRPVDFTTSSKRQVLPGMRYELPPPQDKKDPRNCTAADFAALMRGAGDMPVEKWITKEFLGVSAVLAREIAQPFVGRGAAELSEQEKNGTNGFLCRT